MALQGAKFAISALTYSTAAAESRRDADADNTQPQQHEVSVAQSNNDAVTAKDHSSDESLSYYGRLKYWVQDRDFNLWLMSSAFVLLFTAYPIQGIQTIQYPDTGSYILLVLYGAYGITSLWSALLIDWWGPEICMPFGAITYAIWIATEYSGNNGLVLWGAAAFGWGAGIMWPAAGTILATISTPHNRASNSGIFQMAFHLGVFAGGLILGAVLTAFNNVQQQYSVFLGMCVASVIVFCVHIVTFRRRYRWPQAEAKAAAAAAAAAAALLAGATPADNQSLQRNNTGNNGEIEELHRVVHDDGTVEYLEHVDRATVMANESVVVADLALSGGRGSNSNTPVTLTAILHRMWQPLQFLWNPLFYPCVGVIFLTGGVAQGWFNASFNQIVVHAGTAWNGWIYAISESFGIAAAILFGVFYDKLRHNYQPHKYRWVMYYYIIGFYCMCGCAMAAEYYSHIPLGDGIGQLPATQFYGILIATCFFYNTHLLALEISIFTYLTTFFTYNADIGFSTKVFCEASGYMLSFGLVNVVTLRTHIIIMFAVSVPCVLLYVLMFKAPATPAANVLADTVTAAEAYIQQQQKQKQEQHLEEGNSSRKNSSSTATGALNDKSSQIAYSEDNKNYSKAVSI